MDGEPHWQHRRPKVGAGFRARLAAWTIAVGVLLSSAAVAVSALNAVSTQQAIAMALPAVLITVGGIVGRIVPDAWTAWRRGFRCGCEAAALTSQAEFMRPFDAGRQLREVRLSKVVTYPGPRYCTVCGRGFS